MMKKALLMLLCMALLLPCALAENTQAPEKSALEDNTLVMELDGQEKLLYLEDAYLVGGRIQVTYAGYDPRGVQDTALYLLLDSRIAPGTYTKAGNDESIVHILLKTEGYANALGQTSYKKEFGIGEDLFRKSTHGGVDFSFYVTYDYQNLGSVALRLDERSQDWKTYAGVFAVVLDNGYDDTFAILKKGRFNFTLDEKYEGQLPSEAADPSVPSVSIGDLLGL